MRRGFSPARTSGRDSDSVVREVGGNAVLAVVGNQGDSTEVRRIRAAGDDRVRLIGPVPDARTIMGAFDVYVTPTRRPGESFGIAPAEAMAQGVPVVTMNVGGTAEIVEHGVSGFALPAVAADWRHTIRMLQSDPARLARYGAAARDRIKTRFSPEAIADDCLDLYRRAVAAAR
jgi:glycosyltransferase involved in cell wall biosynthesis